MNLLVGNSKIESFLRWWLHELAEMLPNVNPITINSSKNRMNIHLEKNRYQLHWENDENIESIDNIFSSDEALTRYKQLVEQNNKLSVQACNLMLHKEMILSREIILPLATEQNLENVVAYEIDRYTPFKSDDVYFDAHVISRNKVEKKIIVLLRVAKKSAMRELLKFVNESQLLVQNIYCVDNNAEPIGESLKFGEVLNSSIDNKRHGLTNKFLLILAGILFATTLILPVAKNYWNANSYDSERLEISKKVVEVKEILSTYRKMKKDIELSASLNKNNSKIIVLLDELTSAISDDTSLNRLSIEDGILRMQGVSVSASKLVSALDSTQNFSGVRFVAPVTQNRASGNENFTIEMTLKASENANAIVK